MKRENVGGVQGMRSGVAEDGESGDFAAERVSFTPPTKRTLQITVSDEISGST